jgi:hypothetical protein
MTAEQLSKTIIEVDRGVAAVEVDTPFGTYRVARPTIKLDGALGVMVEGELELPGKPNPCLGMGLVRLETASDCRVVASR